MYRLNLSPDLADKIGLTSDELATLKNVRERADNYLSEHPDANCDPDLAKHIHDVAMQQQRERDDSQRLRDRFK